MILFLTFIAFGLVACGDEKDPGGDTPGGDNPGGKDVFSSTLSYYSKANGLIGTELKMSLRSIITSTHKKVTTYAELKTYLQNDISCIII